MDPYTINRLGQIRQQEILQKAAEDRYRRPIREISAHIGAWLIIMGQKLMTAANPSTMEQPIVSNINAENC